MTALAVWGVRLLEFYLLVGLVVAIPFVIRGIQRIDPLARRSTWGFRLIVLPGAVALWPVLLRRWIGGGPPQEERTPHRGTARRRAP